MGHSNDTAPIQAQNGLAQFPVAMFAMAMGLLGYAVALDAVAVRYDWAAAMLPVVRIIAIAVFCVVTVVYLMKLISSYKAVLWELRHPIRVAYFPTIPISLMFIAMLLLNIDAGLARISWGLGTGLQAALMLGVFSRWIGSKPYQHTYINSVWFLPVIGNLIIPIAGVPLGYIDLSWLFFSMGLMFWLILLSLVMNRVVFHGPPLEKVVPTLVMLIAPPAAGFIAYAELTPDGDSLAHILLNIGYSFGLIALVQLPRLLKMPFDLSLWASFFAVALLAIAALRFGMIAEVEGHVYVGVTLFGVLTVAAIGLISCTVMGLIKGDVMKAPS